MPPKTQCNSGIYKYSQELNKNNEHYILHIPSGKLRYVIQFFIFPFILIYYSSKFKKIIIPEEGLGWMSMFFFGNIWIIVHDIRESEYSSGFVSRLKQFYLWLSFFSIKKADVIIFVSEFTQQSFFQKYKTMARTKVIYNAIDKDNMNFQEKKIDSEIYYFVKNNKAAQIPIFLYVGSDETRKNTINLALAIKDITKSKELAYIRVGRVISAPNYEKVENILQGGNCLLKKEINNETLIFLYSSADAFIMPSKFEGFGRPPVEAQSYGVPVISSLNSGLKEVLRDSVVKIEEPCAPDNITQAIKLFFTLNKNNLSKLSFNNSQRFAKETIQKEFITLLESECS